MKLLVFVCLLAVAFGQTHKEIATDFAKGVLKGFEHSSLPDLPSCLTDFESVYRDVQQAIVDFKKKTYDGVKEAIALLGQALEAVADAMTRCQAAEKEIEKVVKVLAQLKNPKAFFVQIGKNILINGKDIWNEANAAFTLWQSQQYEPSGEQVGMIISKMLGTGVEVARVDADVKIIAQVFLGVLQGFESQAIPSLDACIKDVDRAAKAFTAAFQDFEKGTWESVKNGLKELGQALDILADSMTICEAVPAEVKKVIAALKQLKDPKTFVWTAFKNLLVNGKEILAEMTAAHDNWKNQQYFACGQAVGHIVKKLLLGEHSLAIVHDEPTVKKVEQLFAGILMGFEHKALPHIDPCITEVVTAFNDFYAAFKLFEQKTYDSVRQALVKIADGLNVLANAMETCKAVPEDVKKLVQIIKTLSNPKTLIWTVAKNLILNGKEIFGEINSAYTFWKNQEYFQSGEQIGFIISKLLGTGLELEIVGDQPVDCSGAGAHLKITKMSFSPDPPVKGQPIHVVAAGNLDKTITDGDVHIVVKYLGIKVLDNHSSLCSLLEQAGQKCPVPAQPLSIDISQPLPSSIPSGSYEAQINAVDQNGQEVTCIKVKFKI